MFRRLGARCAGLAAARVRRMAQSPAKRPKGDEVVVPKVEKIDGRSYFHMGPGTHRVPMAMHRRHRERLVSRLRPLTADGHFVVVQGGSTAPVYDTDTDWDFKQESNFQWLFGVKEGGCLAAICVKTGRSLLFVPDYPQAYASWMGTIKSKGWFRETYEVDEVHYVDDVASALTAAGARTLMLMNGTNRDSGISTSVYRPKFDGMERFAVQDDMCLFDALCELRVVKDEDEIALMQWTNDVSAQAHIQVMRKCQGPDVMEYINEATFKYHSYLRGCARVGYYCICPGGERNTFLHYGSPEHPNDQPVPPDCLRLNDMGAEYHCYTADVTVTWPQSGKFSPDQKMVYEAVWAATLAVEKAVKPGVSWVDMHRLSERVLLSGLRDGGLFTGDVEEMLAADLCASFMPHGLGHMLGLDVHDVGGYEPGHTKADLKLAKPWPVTVNLRCGRVLQAGNIITVEPGFYFTEYLIEQALADERKSKFINRGRLEQLRPVGGVRIEDNIVITQSGCRVLTNVPREPADVEAVIAGAEWTAQCREYTA